MVRLTSFLLLIQLLACTHEAPNEPIEITEDKPILSLAAKTQVASNIDALSSCASQSPLCPNEEKKLPFLCVAYRYEGRFLWETQRVYAWGTSLCKARQSLQAEACQKNIESSLLSEIHCNPDSSLDSCPAPLNKNCPGGGQASVCFATQYRDQDIPWTQQPLAWNDSECQARNALLTKACQLGLNPKNLGKITCQDNPNPTLCPPTPPTCLDTVSDPTLCQIKQSGDMKPEDVWTATGQSLCEAQYRLQELACRLNHSEKHPTPEQLGQMECRSLVSLH